MQRFETLPPVIGALTGDSSRLGDPCALLLREAVDHVLLTVRKFFN